MVFCVFCFFAELCPFVNLVSNLISSPIKIKGCFLFCFNPQSVFVICGHVHVPFKIKQYQLVYECMCDVVVPTNVCVVVPTNVCMCGGTNQCVWWYQLMYVWWYQTVCVCRGGGTNRCVYVWWFQPVCVCVCMCTVVPTSVCVCVCVCVCVVVSTGECAW